MVEEHLKELTNLYLHGLKHTPSGWLKRDCMLCHHKGHSPDTRERFGILYSPDGAIAINCFNCGFSTAWRPGTQLSKKFIFFLKTIGVPEEDVNQIKFEAFREEHNVKTKNVSLKGNITQKWTPINLSDTLEDCYSIQSWLEAGCEDKNFIKVLEYMDSRKLLDTDKMYWTPTTDFLANRRVIIPMYFRGKVVGWTGRLVYNADKSVPKYYNNMPNGFIYGLDDQHDYDKQYVIINEGIFDAMVTKGIALLHNNISNEQADVINMLPSKKVLLPDRDKSSEPLINIALENKWAVSFPNWGRDSQGRTIKDASHAVETYGHLLTMQSIISSIETDSYAIKIKRRMDKIEYGY